MDTLVRPPLHQATDAIGGGPRRLPDLPTPLRTGRQVLGPPRRDGSYASAGEAGAVAMLDEALSVGQQGGRGGVVRLAPVSGRLGGHQGAGTAALPRMPTGRRVPPRHHNGRLSCRHRHHRPPRHTTTRRLHLLHLHHREEPTHTPRTTDPVGAPAGADSDAAWSPTSDVAQTRLHPSPRRRYHQLFVALERLLRRTGIPRHLQAHERLRGQPSPRDPRSALRHGDLHPDVTQRRRPPHPHHAHGPVPRSLGPVHRRPGLPATATDAMAPLPDANAPGGIRPREDAERGHGGSGGTGAAPTARRIRLRRRGGRRPRRRGRTGGTRDGTSAGRRRGQVGGHSLAQRRGPTRGRLLGGSQRSGDGRSGSSGGEADR